ncbi:MAG: hypothetical protein HQ508_05720 [Candidatus Marinimicrobia bacterium]|nr:hypothetical protein [Candidatus Neomarinimicrobiota bacterium]
MKSLLIHALRSEAGLIKQDYPLGSFRQTPSDLVIKSLNHEFDILQTGMGLDRCHAALQKIVNPGKYSRVIHFGVSGSLRSDLHIKQMIQGCQFIATSKPTLVLPHANRIECEEVPAVSFFSSDKAITSDSSRIQAIALGGQAVDMESYAVANFCLENNLDLLALRCISDRAGDSTGDDFKKHYNEAASTVQNFLMKHILSGTKC